MRRAHCKFVLVLAAFGLLISCDEGTPLGSASPEAAQQFAELRQEVKILTAADFMAEYNPEEMLQTVQNFEQTANAKYISPTGKYTILHIACMLKKPELARCLLLDGADPNAYTVIEGSPAESPLLCALTADYSPDIPAETINALIDVLVAGGATLATPGSVETSLTYNACLTCAHEAVYAHLLDIGVPRSGNELQEAAYRGWLNTIKRLLEEEGGLTADHHSLITIVAHMSGGYFPGEHLACTRYLLEQGVSVNATDEAGRTALFCLAAGFSTLEEYGRKEAALELITFLLQQGADPHLRADNDETYPGFSAYDLMAQDSSIMEHLHTNGITLTAPPLVIRDGEMLAADVCRAGLTQSSAETIAPYFDTIARLFTPTTEMSSQEIYPDALRSAVILLANVDAERTSALIASLPIWKDREALVEHNHTVMALLYALQDAPSIILPKELLLETSEILMENKAHENAAITTELLGRCADSDEALAGLLEDSRLPIRAGAWGALLHKAGLPSACNGSVAEWLAYQGRTADTPALQKALLLTSIEDLWYGNMESAKIEEFISLVNELGAERAAAAYRNIADNLSNPDKLDEIMQTNNEWSYELEIATARFILDNKEEFLSPSDSPNDAP